MHALPLPLPQENEAEPSRCQRATLIQLNIYSEKKNVSKLSATATPAGEGAVGPWRGLCLPLRHAFISPESRPQVAWSIRRLSPVVMAGSLLSAAGGA